MKEYTYYYKGKIIGRGVRVPIVGDEFEGHYVWAVDYASGEVWLTD